MAPLHSASIWRLMWWFLMQSVKVATKNLTFLKKNLFPMLVYAFKTIKINELVAILAAIT
jgi:hypothetical protein